MPPLKAHVRNGRLVLDEPTELPEGATVFLQPMPAQELDDPERARLHEALRESIEQMKSGQTLDASDALAELRAHR
jgi:hypothetical protein